MSVHVYNVQARLHQLHGVERSITQALINMFFIKLWQHHLSAFKGLLSAPKRVHR
jgi:hypothetical protein